MQTWLAFLPSLIRKLSNLISKAQPLAELAGSKVKWTTNNTKAQPLPWYETKSALINSRILNWQGTEEFRLFDMRTYISRAKLRLRLFCHAKVCSTSFYSEDPLSGGLCIVAVLQVRFCRFVSLHLDVNYVYELVILCSCCKWLPCGCELVGSWSLWLSMNWSFCACVVSDYYVIDVNMSWWICCKRLCVVEYFVMDLTWYIHLCILCACEL